MDLSETVLTLEERTRIGARLRGLRAERALKVADLAQRVPIAENTITAAEHGNPRVRYYNLQKIARTFGTSIEAILVPPPPPVLANLTVQLLDGLNDEHLAIAVAYRNARRLVRVAMEALVQSPAHDSVLALVARLLTDALSAEQRSQIEWVLDDDPALRDTWVRIRTRCLADPSFASKMLHGVLDLEDQIAPLPPKRRATSARPSSPPIDASAPARRA